MSGKEDRGALKENKFKLVFQLACFQVGNNFDLEITDGKVTKQIKHNAMKLFSHWYKKRYISMKNLLPGQKLNKWRPKDGIAIITCSEKLFKLTCDLSESVLDHEILFEFENVLRVKILGLKLKDQQFQFKSLR